jgi:hypothetical protein
METHSVSFVQFLVHTIFKCSKTYFLRLQPSSITANETENKKGNISCCKHGRKQSILEESKEKFSPCFHPFAWMDVKAMGFLLRS